MSHYDDPPAQHEPGVEARQQDAEDRQVGEEHAVEGRQVHHHREQEPPAAQELAGKQESVVRLSAH